MGIKFTNNASSNIINALPADATSVSITPDTGDLFPSLTEGDYFYATLAGNNGLEIVKVTNRVKDTMTIVRAQDNTTALSFDMGDLFELRIVAADFEDTFSHVETTLEDTVSNVETTLENTVDALNTSVDNKMSSYLPLSGGTVTGVLECRNIVGYGDYSIVGGAQDHSKNSYIQFYNATSNHPGQTLLVTRDGTQEGMAVFRPDGTFMWNMNPVLTSAGGTLTGPIKHNNVDTVLRASTNGGQTRISGGSLGWNAGGIVSCYGVDSPATPGGVMIAAMQPGSSGSRSLRLMYDLEAQNWKFKWGENDVLTSGRNNMEYGGALNFNPYGQIRVSGDAASYSLTLFGDADDFNATCLRLYSKNITSSNTKGFSLQAGDGTTSCELRGKGNKALTWGGDPVITQIAKKNNDSTGNYVKYSNGLIIQWGYEDLATGAVKTLPTPFAGYYSVVAVHQGSANIDVQVNDLTPTTFTVRHSYSQAVNIMWIAIGF